MNKSDLIHRGVEVDDDEVDESFDEETGEARPRSNGVNGREYPFEDSSEEEDDDDDEEAAREVCSSPQAIHFMAVDWFMFCEGLGQGRIHCRRRG